MPDPARARRLAKRISTIVASAIEFEIKDPPLAFVTVTDTKVTGDLHDATTSSLSQSQPRRFAEHAANTGMMALRNATQRPRDLGIGCGDDSVEIRTHIAFL